MKQQAAFLTKLTTALALITASSVINAEAGLPWLGEELSHAQPAGLACALQASEAAASVSTDNEQLTMEKAQTYRDQDDNKSAYWEYQKNQFATDPDIRREACVAMNELHWDRHKRLEYPYFADLSISGGYQSISAVSHADAKFRYGRSVGGGENPLQIYAFISASGDNRSGLVGGFPAEIYDNVAIAGVGARKTLNEEWGISIFAEAGYAYDLVYLGRERGRFDGRAGLEMYRNWNTDYSCTNGDTTPNRFVMRAYGSLTYYTRYDDTVLLDLSLKPGVRIYETSESYVDAFVYLGGTADLRYSDNSFGQAGVGLMWSPDRQSDFTISAMATEVFYNNGTSEPSFELTFDFYDLW